MGSRSARISLFVIALLASAGLGYLAVADQRALAAAGQDGAAIDQSAEDALSALLDVRGSMYAYVAPNQGTEFWGGRVSTLLDTLRQRLATLDAAMAASGGSLAESLDGIDQLAAADKRARQYADRGELLVAGDVLFTEVRDLLNAVTQQVTGARSTLRSNAAQRVAGLRQEQAALAAATLAVWFITALMLMPGSVKPIATEPGEWRNALADTLKKPIPAEELNLDIKKVEPANTPPVVVAVPAPQVDLKAVAEICAGLSSLSDIGELSGALAQASNVIGAKGLIVWAISNNGASLSPVSTHGFDARVVERIGLIDRSSANLTAEALRENAPRVSAAAGSVGAALAVPMCGPAGPVGVLSAELQPGKKADETCVAVASILAAQLATLTAPVPAVERRVESAAS